MRSPADWLIEYLSEPIAMHLGRATDDIASAIRQGTKTGALPAEIWQVEHPDGTRTRERGFTRSDFFGWCGSNGGLGVTLISDEWRQVWPPELFRDNRRADIYRIYARWNAHAGISTTNFHAILCHVVKELAVFRWTSKDLGIRRDDFVAWYEASPLSSSVIADVRPVSAEELWPLQAKGGRPAKLITDYEVLGEGPAAHRALSELFPKGVPQGAHIGKVKRLIGDHIVSHGGGRPSDKTIGRELYKLKAKR